MSDKKTDLNLEAEELPKEQAEEQEIDDTDTPDFLAQPKRGKGVRRLNRVPLIAIGGIILLAVVAISYTFISRQNQNAGKVAQGPQAPVNNTNSAPVQPTGGDYVAAPSAPAGNENGPPSTPQGGQSNPTGSASTPERSEAYQNRLRMIARLEEKKLNDAEMALDADPNVSMNKSSNGGVTAQQVNQRQQSNASQVANGDSQFQQYGAGMNGGMGMGGGDDSYAANRQDQKNAYLSGSPQTDVYLKAQRMPAIDANQEIKAGTIIPGVMISGLNSDLPGQIVGQVRENVYDSATGKNLLIPAGARLVGQYDSGVTIGQERALVVWERVIFPDSSSISLAKMPGADMGGYAGFNDKVNNHYGKLFFNALLLSTFSAGVQLSQPQAQNGENYSSSQIIAGSMGQQLGQLGMQLAQRGMNVQPTLEIRPGYSFNIMVNKDIILPNWQGHPMSAGYGSSN